MRRVGLSSCFTAICLCNKVWKVWEGAMLCVTEQQSISIYFILYFRSQSGVWCQAGEFKSHVFSCTSLMNNKELPWQRVMAVERNIDEIKWAADFIKMKYFTWDFHSEWSNNLLYCLNCASFTQSHAAAVQSMLGNVSGYLCLEWWSSSVTKYSSLPTPKRTH